MSHSQSSPQGAQQPVLAYDAGTLLESLTVTDLTVDGGAVARHQGQVVFLDAGLPGDVLSARVVKRVKRVVHAQRERSLHPSPHAVEPWCPHAADCGACSWQHLSPEAALAWKQKHVRETLARIGKVVEPDVSPLVPSPRDRGYRNKMSFAFAPGATPDHKTLLGLRRFREQSVVEVTDCGLQTPEVMRMLAGARQMVNDLGLEAWQGRGAGYLRFLVVHTPMYEPLGKKQMVVECITGDDHRRIDAVQEDSGGDGDKKPLSNADKVRELGQALMRDFGLTGFVHSERRHPADLAQGERRVFLAGSGKYQERFGHLVLTVPHNAFLQTNTDLAALLYAGVAEEAGLTGREVLWDLYSGVGGIALYLADRVKEAHGFEIQAEAVASARKNSERLGHAHCHFHHGALSSSLLANVPRPDVIIADPPRAGIDEPVLKLLLTTPARRLVYVSCDPGTQARDIARLAPAWKMLRGRPYDMFPYTPHMETIVVLDRITG